MFLPKLQQRLKCEPTVPKRTSPAVTKHEKKKDRHDARGMGCHVLMPDFCLNGPQQATKAEWWGVFSFLPLLKLTAARGLCTLR